MHRLASDTVVVSAVCISSRVISPLISPVPVTPLPGRSIVEKPSSFESVPLWRLVMALLPEKGEGEFYTVKEVAPIVGLRLRSIQEHAHDLWRDFDGHYRLNQAQTEKLVRRVCQVGRKLPSRAAIIAQLHARGIEAKSFDPKERSI